MKFQPPLPEVDKPRPQRQVRSPGLRMPVALVHLAMKLSGAGTILGVLAMLALYVAEAAFGLAWLLRLLEIASAFDRWLPGLTTWQLLGAFLLSGCIQFYVSKLLQRLTEQ